MSAMPTIYLIQQQEELVKKDLQRYERYEKTLSRIVFYLSVAMIVVTAGWGVYFFYLFKTHTGLRTISVIFHL